MFDKKNMLLALEEAKIAQSKKEIPVGCIIINRKTGLVISKSHNLIESAKNPNFHAEMLCLDQAHKITGEKYLFDHDMYVNLEPCIMCSGAIALSKIGRLFFGAYSEKTGAVDNGHQVFKSSNIYQPEIYGGICEVESRDILKDFFAKLK